MSETRLLNVQLSALTLAAWHGTLRVPASFDADQIAWAVDFLGDAIAADDYEEDATWWEGCQPHFYLATKQDGRADYEIDEDFNIRETVNEKIDETRVLGEAGGAATEQEA